MTDAIDDYLLVVDVVKDLVVIDTDAPVGVKRWHRWLKLIDGMVVYLS